MAQALVEAQISKGGHHGFSSKLMKYAAKRMAHRGAGRLIPFIGAPISSIQNGGSTKQLGRKALATTARTRHSRRPHPSRSRRLVGPAPTPGRTPVRPRRS